MNTEIVTVTYATSQQTSPDTWYAYNDVLHFGMENTLADVAKALRARHHFDKYRETHAEIHFHKVKEGEKDV